MSTYIYIAVLALTCFFIRVLPLTLIRKPISNPFVQSFLYYVPYVTLSVMTFPAILTATFSPLGGAAALIVGVVCAWRGANLFQVACACSGIVLILGFFI